jgi:hypothetical protein
MPSMSVEMPERQRSAARECTIAVARIAWALARLPLLALLIILEPFVCGLLWLSASLGVLTCLFYRFLVHEPRFPFWGGLALSIGLALLAAAYNGVIRLIGGPEE